MPSRQVSVEEMPSELRSRALAAAGNASFRAVSASDGLFTVYALSGDQFTRMRMALRPDGSVREETDVWPLSQVLPGPVDGALGPLVLGEEHPTALVVPAAVVEAVRNARQPGPPGD